MRPTHIRDTVWIAPVLVNTRISGTPTAEGRNLEAMRSRNVISGLALTWSVHAKARDWPGTSVDAWHRARSAIETEKLGEKPHCMAQVPLNKVFEPLLGQERLPFRLGPNKERSS